MSAAVLPRIDPAIPTLTEPFHRPGWVYEEKIDGWRIIAYRNRDDVRLISRTGRDHTKRFPDVARAIAQGTARRSPHFEEASRRVWVYLGRARQGGTPCLVWATKSCL